MNYTICNILIREIIQTYGDNAKQIELEKMIQRRQEQFQEQIAWQKQYYTEHPEDLNITLNMFFDFFSLVLVVHNIVFSIFSTFFPLDQDIL